MYDLPIVSSGCRSPRSKKSRPIQTFPEDDITSTNSKNTIYNSPFELRSESELDEYDQILSDSSFPTNSKDDYRSNSNAIHPSSYANTSISKPIMIPEPIIKNNQRGFLPPQILAQSPKSNNFLNDDGDFEFYPDEFYPSTNGISNFQGTSLFCFSEDDDDFDKRNGFSVKKPGNSEKPNDAQNSNSNFILKRKDGDSLQSSFDEFDTKINDKQNINNASIKSLNNKFFNYEFDDSNDETSNTNNNNNNNNVGLSTKFSQPRLLKFSEESSFPVSFEPTRINDDSDHRDDDDLPKPIIPITMVPSHFLLEFQKHEAEENLKNAQIEWDDRIEKQKEISRNKFAELHAKQKMESAPFESRKTNKNSTSPQRLELISGASSLEQPVFRVRTVPSASISKAINEYKLSKEGGIEFEYDIFSPGNIKKPKSAVPPSEKLQSPMARQTARPMPMTPDPSSLAKDPKRRTIFKATSEIPGFSPAVKRKPLSTAASAFVNQNTKNLAFLSTDEMKREKKILEDKHKQEVLALNAECSAAIKALQDKKNADIAMKESQLKAIEQKIEIQKKNDQDLVRNKNAASPENCKKSRFEFGVTGRLNRKQ